MTDQARACPHYFHSADPWKHGGLVDAVIIQHRMQWVQLYLSPHVLTRRNVTSVPSWPAKRAVFGASVAET